MGNIDPWKFVKKSEKVELRPNLTGLGYKDGYVYATDAYILLRQKDPYAKKYEGKVISKEGKVISEKPPKYVAVIPDLKLYRPWRIDTSRLDMTIKSGSTGPHLHFTLRKNGQLVDPESKFNFK